MSKIIAVCNQKGGTGKTTTTINLASALAVLDKKILIVDMDPQGNASSGVGVNKNEIKESLYDVLIHRISIDQALTKTGFNNLHIIPCNINLTGAEIELVGVLSRETRLKKALDSIKQCEFYALEGVSQLLNTIALVKEGLNPELHIEGVLMTMADFRTNLTNEVINEIKNYFKEKVYKSIITRNIRLSEAPSFGKPINYYDSASVGSIRYKELAEEFLLANVSSAR